MDEKIIANHEDSRASTTTEPISGMVAWDKFYQGIGITRETAYKWRRKGLIKPFEIFGRLYVEIAEIRRFREAALRGDYADGASLVEKSQLLGGILRSTTDGRGCA